MEVKGEQGGEFLQQKKLYVVWPYEGNDSSQCTSYIASVPTCSRIDQSSTGTLCGVTLARALLPFGASGFFAVLATLAAHHRATGSAK